VFSRASGLPDRGLVVGGSRTGGAAPGDGRGSGRPQPSAWRGGVHIGVTALAFRFPVLHPPMTVIIAPAPIPWKASSAMDSTRVSSPAEPEPSERGRANSCGREGGCATVGTGPVRRFPP
jgi:hypothetical protein